ncbi:MAG: hypothetical protein JW895_04705 [Thermoleophilaceae bacterium]|nr:hypothetical protein [Thermoleophilaceae bacterium]
MLAISAVALAGCYGSTEPATDVGISSATLNARGTANNGPAHAYFQYWLTGSERDPSRAGGYDVPAGASGPVSARVTGLAAASSYSFRLCGWDRDVDPEGSSGPEVCAQTRTFTTAAPVEDALRGGFWAGCCSRLDVDAKSAPDGGSPRGSVSWHRSSSSSPDPPRVFSGFVTCLAVGGSRAAVGAVGKWTQSGAPDANATFLITVVDGRAHEDTYHEVETAGSAPPNCGTASFASQSTLIDPNADFIVDDAASSIPTNSG